MCPINAKHEQNTDKYQSDSWTNVTVWQLCLQITEALLYLTQTTGFRTNQSDNKEVPSSQSCKCHLCIDHPEYDNVTVHFCNDSPCCSHLQTSQHHKVLATVTRIYTPTDTSHKIHNTTREYLHSLINHETRMWANTQRDRRPAEYRRRPLFNAAKFGWRPVLECRAVTLPRSETRWNLQGCPKLANRSQPLVRRSSPYYDDMWRKYRSVTIFFHCQYMP